jgi:periplasmic protein CpxP/Spy
MKAILFAICFSFCFLAVHAQETLNEFKEEKENIVKELNMTPEQEKEYIQLREKRRSSTMQLHNNISLLRKEMRIAMNDESSSKDQIFSFIDKISNLKAQVQKERIEFIFGMKEILTPEQFSQMKAIQGKKEMRKEKNHKDYGKKKTTPKKY